MKTSIRLVFVLAVAVIGFSVLPAFADADVYAPGLKVVGQPTPRLLTLDRKYAVERPTPMPIVNPKPEDPPAFAIAAPSHGGTSTSAGGPNTPSTLGSAGFGVSTKTQIVERSLRSVAERLR